MVFDAFQHGNCIGTEPERQVRSGLRVKAESEMRSVPAVVALMLFSTPCYAQIAGPNIFAVVGAADFSSAGTVGIPQVTIFSIIGLNLSASTTILTGPILLTEINGLNVGIRMVRDYSKVVAQAGISATIMFTLTIRTPHV